MSESKLILVDTEKRLKALCDSLEYARHYSDPFQRAFAFDTETYIPDGTKKILKMDGASLDQARIMYLSFARNNVGWGIPLSSFAPGCLDTSLVLESLEPYFADDVLTVVMHNANYDANMLLNHGIKINMRKMYCTMIASHLWDENLPMSLKERCTLVGMRLRATKTVDMTDLDEVTEYACEDALATWELYRAHELGRSTIVNGMKRDMRITGLRRKFFQMEMTALQGVIRMERRGMKVSPKKLCAIDKKLDKQLNSLAEILYIRNGKPFNINSRPQLAKFLYEELGLQAEYYTPKGAPATHKLALAYLQGKNQYAAKVVEYNKLAALRHYVSSDKGLQSYADHANRIHSTFSQVGARTARSSSRQPNLQQIPSKTDVMGIRQCFIEMRGHVLIVADMDQLELCLMANHSRDKMMLHAYRNNVSIHIQTGVLTGLLPKGVTKDDIKQDLNLNRPYMIAKNCNFGLMYEGSAWTLQRQLVLEGIFLTEQQCRDIVEKYWDVYSGVPHYRYRLYEQCRRQGYIQNICGRPYRIENMNSSNRRWRAAAERQCINCFDAETEALTQRGWIRGFDLKATDVFLTKNADTGMFEWHNAIRRWFYPDYEGSMVRISNGTSLDVLTTPEHRWLVTNRRTGKPVMKTSEELVSMSPKQSDYAVHLTGDYTQKWSAYTDDFASLVGWVMSDGSIANKYINIAQTKKHRREEIKALLERNAYIYNEHTPSKRGDGVQPSTQYKIYGTIVDLFKMLFPEKTLTFEFILSLGDSQRKALFDSMMAGDGDDKWRSMSTSKFTAGTEERADVFQFLCAALGIASCKRYRKYRKQDLPKNGRKGYWIVVVKSRKTAQTSKSRRIRKYKGGVWCVTVPNSYAVFRRKGNVFISGNTQIQGGGADYLKLAMIRCDACPKLKALRCRMLMGIHDELIFRAPEKNADSAAKIVKKHMETNPPNLTIPLTIPLTASVGIGPSWGEAK